MTRNLHPKCANPACAAAFDWLGGGKLFRFHRVGRNLEDSVANEQVPTIQPVEHFWLCERCTGVFTITYEQGHGVVLQRLRPELQPAPRLMELGRAKPLQM